MIKKRLTVPQLLGAFFLFYSGMGMAQYKIDPKFENLIKEKHQPSLKNQISGRLITEDLLPTSSIVFPNGTAKELYHAIIYTTDGKQLKNEGYLVQSEAKTFVTALLSIEDIERLRNNKSVISVMAPGIDKLNNQQNTIESGAALLHNKALFNTAYTGKGVLVGIYDTGIDFTHPDFRDPADPSKSRIVSIWDQTITAVENTADVTPAGFDFGVEYTQQQINDEIDGTPANYIREKDINGHGTHVAGSVAGNGSALSSRAEMGMAPEADIVIVKGGNGSFPTTNTIAALDYFKSVAEKIGKPIVVNMSIGGQGSPHDGNGAHELKVNEFTASGPGRVVVISAGNEGDGNIHQRISLAQGEKKSFNIQVGNIIEETNNAPIFSFLTFNKGTNEDSPVIARLTAPDGNIYTQKAGSQGKYYIKNPTDPTKNIISMQLLNYVDSASKKRFTQLVVNRTAITGTKGTYSLEIENTSENQLTIDGWLYSINSDLATTTLPFGDNYYTVGSPGTADEAITVANYVGKNAFAVNSSNPTANATYSAPYITGQLNSSSSKGPRADEALKPDIAAGGTFVISARSKDVTDPYIIDGQYYSQMTGTSMSSPTVAGATALLLQANGQLTAKEVKKRLTENTTKDQITTNSYTNEFGYGKLNIYKAVYDELNHKNNNGTCPPSNNITLAYDNQNYLFGAANGTGVLNYGTGTKVAVKYTPATTGKLGSAVVFLGNYNTETAAAIPMTVEVRKADENGKPGAVLATKTIPNVKLLEQSGWNTIDFIDQGINVTKGEDFFITVGVDAAPLRLVVDSKNIDQRSYRSTDNGQTFAIDNTYDAKLRAVVYEDKPGIKQLATSSREASQAVQLGYNYFINSCELITRVEASGSLPVTGNTTAKVWMDPSQQSFVRRKIEVNADNNNSVSTGKVTLFYSQEDFDLYNASHNVKLPTSHTDENNKTNIYIHFYAGKSSDNTGNPDSYAGAPLVTNVQPNDIVWNDTYGYWEVTVNATGFGGYLITGNKTLDTKNTALNTLTVYPNPVKDQLNITLPAGINKAAVRIFDMSGKSVSTNQINQDSAKINVSALTAGAYIVEINTAAGVVSKKIIKQ